MNHNLARSNSWRAFATVACMAALLSACVRLPQVDSAGSVEVSRPSSVPGSAETLPSANPTPDGEGQSDAIGSLTIPISFGEGGELEVAVADIDVVGNLTRLQLTITANIPPNNEEVAVGAILLGDESSPASAIAPELIDPVNLKAYEAVEYVRQGTAVYLTSGKSRTLEFYYAAPQDDMKSVDIVLSSQVPAIKNVPVSA